MSRFLVFLGLMLLLCGLFWPVIQKIGLGRLPGDIAIERGNFRLYIPVATSVLLSLVLSFLLWFLRR
ncbi:MAG TPA: DUF2905 domain-containing protein [Stellaceae bacterium]|nr:DUF2905 domain-containing protein [Stellaceae bacterium]